MQQNPFDTMAAQPPVQQPSQQQSAPAVPQTSTSGSDAPSSPGSGNPFDTLAAQTPAAKPNDPSIGGFKDGNDWGSSSTINTDDDTSLWKQGAEQVSAVGAGIGKGLLDTLSGAAGMVGATGLKQRFDEGRQELDKDNAGNPTLNSIGYGGETLAEFLMGDEALKGLSFADRLGAVAKTAKILEKSPRLIKALQIGAAAGVVQGTQTGIRTDGSLLDRAKAGAESGAIGAGAAGTIGAAGDWLGEKALKLGKGLIDTNDTLDQVFNQQQSVKSAADRAQGLADDVNDAKAKIDEQFNKTKAGAEAKNKQSEQTASTQARSDRDSAQATRDSDTADAFENKQQAKDTVDATKEAKEEQAKQIREQKVQSVKDALETSKKTILQTLVDKFKQKAGNAAAPSDLAETVNAAINKMEEASHTRYENDMNGEGGVIEGLGDDTVDIKDSPLQKAAKVWLKPPDPDDHDMTKAAADMAGQNLRTDVKEWIENAAKGSKTEEIDPEAPKPPKPKKGEKVVKPEPEEIPFKPLSATDLIAQRQWLRQTASGFMRGDPNQQALSKMIEGIDKTLDGMAENADNPDVIQQYKKIRQSYKDSREVLDSDVADKLNLKNASPDKALDDVNKYILGGANPLAKVKTLERIMGKGGIKDLSKTWTSQISKLAETNPEAAMKTVNNLGDELGNKFLGPDQYDELKNIGKEYNQSNAYAEARAATDTAQHITDEAGTKAAAQAAADYQKVINTSAHRQAMVDIRNRFSKSVQSLDDAYYSSKDAAEATKDATIATAQAAKDTASEPYNRAFVNSLKKGDFNEDLEKGKFTPNDINAVKSIIGDAKWRDITSGLMESAIEDANGDPGKFMKWWNAMRPETREAAFLNDPVVGKYNQVVVNKLQQAHGYTRGAKILIGTLGGAVGGGAGLSAPVHLMAPIAQAIAAAAGSVTAVSALPWSKSLVEWGALHPETWKAAAKLGSAIQPAAPGLVRGAQSLAKTAGAGIVSQSALPVARAIKHAYQGASGLSR